MPRPILRSPTLGLLVAAVFCGCTTLKPPEMSQSVSSRHQQTSQQAGLRITVDPWSDRARTEQFFKFDARAVGIAMVKVEIENQSTDASYLILKENVQFARAGVPDSAVNQGGTTRSTAAGEVVGGVTAAAILVMPIAAIPLMFTSAKMMSDATVIRENMSAHELHNSTIAPGQTVRGFLYFQLNKNEVWGNGSSVRLTLKNTRTQAPVAFRFTFTQDQP